MRPKVSHCLRSECDHHDSLDKLENVSVHVTGHADVVDEGEVDLSREGAYKLYNRYPSETPVPERTTYSQSPTPPA